MVVVVLCLAVASCSASSSDQATVVPPSTTPADASSATTSEAGDDTGGSSLRWSPCQEGFECASVTVPLDHDDPGGETLDLALIRRPASDEATRIGSLVLNPGGPGASGYDFLTGARFPTSLKQEFDLVSWDPRGIGRSSPLACSREIDDEAFRELDSDPDSTEEQAELDAASEQIAAQCASSDLALLQQSTTTDTARDLEAIRVAIGDSQLTYMGFSYGTQIGQEYARLFPTKVRAMVLDGVVDPSQTLQEMLAGQAEVIETTFSSETLALYDQLIARSEQEPLEGPEGLSLTPGTIALAGLASAFYERSDDTLRIASRDALAGNTKLIEQIATSYITAASFADYLAVSCTDSPFAAGVDAWDRFADDLKAAAPRFGAPIANELRPCAFWPVAPSRATPAIGIDGLPPILVIGTTGDPATPYQSAERVAAAIPGATLLTFESNGHTAFNKSDCIDEAVAAYLIDLELPPTGTVCTTG